MTCKDVIVYVQVAKLLKERGTSLEKKFVFPKRLLQIRTTFFNTQRARGFVLPNEVTARLSLHEG